LQRHDADFNTKLYIYGFTVIVKLRLPICEIFQLFRSLVHLNLLSIRKVSYIGKRYNKINKRAKKLKNFADQ